MGPLKCTYLSTLVRSHPGWGTYSKLDLQERELIRIGRGLIQKSAALLEDGLVVPEKTSHKGSTKQLIGQRAVKLNYMKLDIFVIMQ